MYRVLICEPDMHKAQQWKNFLEKNNHWVQIVEYEKSIEIFRDAKFHIHLMILSLINDSDLVKISAMKSLRPETAVLAVSKTNQPGFIVDTIRHGASHYWEDQVSLTGLEESIQQILKRTTAVREDVLSFPYSDLIGRHPKILEIYDLINKIKDSDCTVLITGESGTGKEVVARAIHSLSPRKKNPWVAINCSAIPANLLESELFGHVKGAFTGASQNRVGRFQLSQNGTLFLDEIGELSFDLQAKLLRALQHRVFEPVGANYSQTLESRIIAATNQDLEKAVVEKRFREDLFYRLNVIPIHMPALRHRKSDIPILANHFLRKFNQSMSRNIPGFSEEAMQSLMQYHWPGNIRELENLMERVVVLKKESQIIELKDFPVGYFKNIRLDRFLANVALPDEGVDFNQAVDEFENELILQALQRTSGNKNQAAHLLRINRTTLVEKLKRKGIQLSA